MDKAPAAKKRFRLLVRIELASEFLFKLDNHLIAGLASIYGTNEKLDDYVYTLPLRN